ncbi:MAG: hypothetical protein IKQ03_04825 [Prevotella sp.]|nr:hypothetical protein [Prevotella sp.]
MKEIVIQELKRLGIPRIFVVSFDRKGGRHVTEGMGGHDYSCAEECLIFYLFKGCWTIRYIDANKNIHPEFIAKYGFRIAIDEKGNLCLYKDKELRDRVHLAEEDFENCFEKIWGCLADEHSQFHYSLYD